MSPRRLYSCIINKCLLASQGQRALLRYATIPVLLCVLTLLINLVLRRSSLNAKAVDLPLVCCRTRDLPKLTIYVYFLYSATAHSQILFVRDLQV